jgi:hypothetical protein
MKTSEFLQLLQANSAKDLLFEYSPGMIVPANYHITEVKNISIDAVDCGGRSDSWNETIVQLWESPEEIGKTEFMSVYKGLSILKKVGTIKQYDMNAELKIEYGNALFHTAHLFVNDFEVHDNKLIIKLAVTKTDCKAKDICGTPEAVGVETESSCSPESGCC